MITYQYECKCGHFCEAQQSIKDKPLTICPKCNNNDLERVIFGGIGAFVDRGVTTLGKQAEVNSKKMGKTKVEELEAQRPKADTTVAYTDAEKRNKINKMNPKQIERYIIEGR